MREARVVIGNEEMLLTGVALAPEAPFSAEMVRALLAQMNEQVDSGKLFVSFEGDLLAGRMRLRDVVAQVVGVSLSGDCVEMTASMLDTPKGAKLQRHLRFLAEQHKSSGIGFTVVAMGRPGDVRLSGVHLVEISKINDWRGTQ